jgi:hypothetical protein
MISHRAHACSIGGRWNQHSIFHWTQISLLIVTVFLWSNPNSGLAAEAQGNPVTATKPKPSTAQEGGNWRSLFDGKTLAGWRVTPFAGAGEVRTEEGRLILDTGVMTGVTFTNDLPRMNYEVSLDAMRVDGSDFFCGLTFPVGENPCSFIVGGWGGGVVGLSNIDHEDAAHNETTKYMNFENGKWFNIRVRVTSKKIQAWIDSDRVADLETEGRVISIRPEVELSKPLGVASWSTKAALRNIRIRQIKEQVSREQR